MYLGLNIATDVSRLKYRNKSIAVKVLQSECRGQGQGISTEISQLNHRNRTTVVNIFESENFATRNTTFN